MPNLPSRLWLSRYAYILITLGIFLTARAVYYHLHPPTLPNWEQGTLVVLEDAQDHTTAAQFNHQLARQFANFLHSRLISVPVEIDEVPLRLSQQRGHLAAIGLLSNYSENGLIFAPSFQTVNERLIYNNDLGRPKSYADLADKQIAVVAGSAQEFMLKRMALDHPELHWESRLAVGVDGLLDEVAEGTLDVTFANQEQYDLARNFHDNLSTASFFIAPPSELAWSFAPDSDPELRDRATQFFNQIRKDGKLALLIDRYYGFNKRLTLIDSAAFIDEIENNLPKYRSMFEEAAHWTGLEWQLIAALAYQESHWDPLATSFTNVRGMMMLTEDTADQMHVSDRLDPRQSILAGARYLASLRDRLPLRIAEPDRTWMALAAYNQGFGHLEDARVLTQRMGLDSDRWVNVKKWMPKLNEPEHFENLKHGYARGGEAVILVENIRMYYNMIKRTVISPSQETLPVMPYYQLLDTGKKVRIKSFSESK